MSTKSNVPGVPVTERAVVGLCHDLNDQLAAVSAYTFLLKRRGLLGEVDGPLQERLDQIAQSVRLVRSLCRDPQSKTAPVAVSLLAESVSDILHSHPEGQVQCRVPDTEDDRTGVVRCEWASTLRSLLIAAIWVRRGVSPDERAHIELGVGPEANTLIVSMAEVDAELPDQPIEPDGVSRGISLEAIGDRRVLVRLPVAESPRA